MHNPIRIGRHQKLDERIGADALHRATEAEELRDALERVQNFSLEISEAWTPTGAVMPPEPEPRVRLQPGQEPRPEIALAQSRIPGIGACP